MAWKCKLCNDACDVRAQNTIICVIAMFPQSAHCHVSMVTVSAHFSQ